MSFEALWAVRVTVRFWAVVRDWVERERTGQGELKFGGSVVGFVQAAAAKEAGNKMAHTPPAKKRVSVRRDFIFLFFMPGVITLG